VFLLDHTAPAGSVYRCRIPVNAVSTMKIVSAAQVREHSAVQLTKSRQCARTMRACRLCPVRLRFQESFL
jgi:hypothetical protein